VVESVCFDFFYSSFDWFTPFDGTTDTISCSAMPYRVDFAGTKTAVPNYTACIFVDGNSLQIPVYFSWKSTDWWRYRIESTVAACYCFSCSLYLHVLMSFFVCVLVPTVIHVKRLTELNRCRLGTDSYGRKINTEWVDDITRRTRWIDLFPTYESASPPNGFTGQRRCAKLNRMIWSWALYRFIRFCTAHPSAPIRIPPGSLNRVP